MSRNWMPLGQPALEGNELAYIVEAVESGRISSGGPFTARCAALLRDAIGAEEVLLTTSCTDALELAAMLLDLGPDDTVVVPSFTFVSTALAFARTGARIIFCDIEPETLGLCPDHLASLMDDSVRAVVPVHYAGVGARMDEIAAVLARHPRAALVEDNAHGLFGGYRGRPLGSIGRMSTLSFHETKNFVCGEGGALVLNSSEDVARAHVLLDKGTNRQAFFSGDVDKYTWVDVGSSFGLAEVLAAYLFAQLERRDTILASRAQVFETYQTMLAPLAPALGLELPTVPVDRDQAFHMYYVLLPAGVDRSVVLDRMRLDGVNAAFHYVPLHDSPGGRAVAARPTDCPVTHDIAARLVRLPFHNRVTTQDAARVVTSLCDAVAGAPDRSSAATDAA